MFARLEVSGRPRGVSGGAVALCAGLALYLGVQAHGESRVRRANVAGAAGQYDRAIADVDGVNGPGVRTDGLAIRATALAALGSREASAAYRVAVRADPQSWLLRRDWAVLLAAQGRRAGARTQMSRALALNPRMRLPPGFRR